MSWLSLLVQQSVNKCMILQFTETPMFMQYYTNIYFISLMDGQMLFDVHHFICMLQEDLRHKYDKMNLIS